MPPEPEPPSAAATSTSDQIEVTIDGDSAVLHRVDTAWVRDRLRQAAALVNRPVSRIGLQLADDAHMAVLHERHANQPGTTDVLTFELSDRDEPIDVDIAVGVDVAQRSAAERKHDIAREVLLYAVHGLLHCAGYDDHDPDQFDAMHDEEDRILREIGVGAVFRTAVDVRRGEPE